MSQNTGSAELLMRWRRSNLKPVRILLWHWNSPLDPIGILNLAEHKYWNQACKKCEVKSGKMANVYEYIKIISSQFGSVLTEVRKDKMYEG